MSKRLLMPERFRKTRERRKPETGEPVNMPPARQDGRPQYYDIAPGDAVQCVLCLREGKTQQYGNNEAFLNDPANSPLEDGSVYTICRGHLPENAVIFDPGSQVIRNKAGDHTWMEGPKIDLFQKSGKPLTEH